MHGELKLSSWHMIKTEHHYHLQQQLLQELMRVEAPKSEPWPQRNTLKLAKISRAIVLGYRVLFYVAPSRRLRQVYSEGPGRHEEGLLNVITCGSCLQHQSGPSRTEICSLPYKVHASKIVAGQANLGHVAVFHGDAESLAEISVLVLPPAVLRPTIAPHAYKKIVHGQALLVLLPSGHGQEADAGVSLRRVAIQSAVSAHGEDN